MAMQSVGMAPLDLPPLPLDRHSPQFTLRAILTGMLLGGILSVCNVYAGLKVGLVFNMSIVAILLSYGFWMPLHLVTGRRVPAWGVLENNISQTACSAGALIASAGLVAPIPALAMITGQTLAWHYLALWVFSVCLVGISLAVGLRRQMLVTDRLPFVAGVASAETLREMYARGREATARAFTLGSAAVVAAAVKLAEYLRDLKALAIPGSLKGLSLKSLTFGLDPTLLLYGVGGLIGLRAGVSLLIGAVLAFGILAPTLIRDGRLRLTVTEPVPILPCGLTLAPEPESYLRYNEDRHRLEWRGVMSESQQAELLALSPDPLYQEAVHKLYLSSQAVGERGRPRPPQAAQRPMLPADYTTTRRVQISEPLPTYPQGFAIPRQYGGVLRYDARRQVLISAGAITPDCQAAVLARLEEFAAAHPGQASAAADLRAGLERLAARGAESFLPRDLVVPGDLAEVFSYDDASKCLQAAGSPSPEQQHALRDLAQRTGDPDFTATVTSLLAGTRLTPASPNFSDMVKWLLWPGVTLMVVSALVSASFSWRSMAAALTGLRSSGNGQSAAQTGDVSRNIFIGGLVAALILSVWLQVSFFAIAWWAAVGGVLLSFLLALVAARVSGETGITPVGALGKVTQIVFGALIPRNPAPNLMTANVTGGAASQCADLLHDLKCGYLLGASPRLQSLAQVGGALAGALVGSAAYLALVPNPNEQLLTEELPAPGVAGWKAVAELFMKGFQALPDGAAGAMAIAAIAAVLLAILERAAPKRLRPWTPSPASVGLAFVFPASVSIVLFIGGLLAFVLSRCCRSWTERFLIAVCAGIIAGDTLTGVSTGIHRLFAG
jgi:uncharacterized oligopeptide transporter (OPT) family protein